MKTAIITGATGFIGTHLAETLLANGVEVYALCRAESRIQNLLAAAKVIYNTADLQKADVLYHAAWAGGVGNNRTNAALQAKNAILTLQALETAHSLGAKFVGIGTIKERIYTHIMESTAFGSSNFYILTKHFSYAACNQLAYSLNADFVWCQVSHSIGRNMDLELFIGYVISKFIKGEPLELGEGKNFIDIVAIEDVANALYLAGFSETPKRQYYIGSGQSRTVREYVEEIRDVLGVDTPLTFGGRPDDGLVFKREWFDIRDIAHDLGFSPQISFEQAVLNTAAWIQEQKF
ncbi:MAG: NAD(P)-dependent oxidoreductase [Turicibacter sp.]|nr:NAD(P)-dependent oxidoreductase [Turicibacter sp.]